MDKRICGTDGFMCGVKGRGSESENGDCIGDRRPWREEGGKMGRQRRNGKDRRKGKEGRMGGEGSKGKGKCHPHGHLCLEYQHACMQSSYKNASVSHPLLRFPAGLL